MLPLYAVPQMTHNNFFAQHQEDAKLTDLVNTEKILVGIVKTSYNLAYAGWYCFHSILYIQCYGAMNNKN